MNATSRRPLLDHWLWEARMLRVFVIVAAVVPLVACGVLLPFLGANALWTLVFLGMPLMIGLGYRPVGRRVGRLHDSLSPGEGPAIQALLVRGALQSPGIVTIGPHALTLRPIVGERLEVRLDDVSAVRETRFFNGTLLAGKTGFWLTVPGYERLGCAVPDSFAELLRTRLVGHVEQAASENPA